MNSRGLASDSALITILCADLMVQHIVQSHTVWVFIWGVGAVAWAVISILRISS